MYLCLSPQQRQMQKPWWGQLVSLDQIAVSSFSIVIFNYWYCKVPHQYCHGPLLVMAFNCAPTSIGMSALWFSTRMGTIHYRHWHAIMPIPVLALLHVGSVPVWHSPLPKLAFNCASTGIGISAFWFSTSMVLAFLHFGSVPVLAHTITGTGIQKWCLYRYWHCCTLVQYRYGHSPLLVLAFNFARTGIGISALRFSTSTSTVHYPHWHSKMVPVPELPFLHFG